VQQTGIVRYGEIGRGERENGVAQVGPGEVANVVAVGDLGSKFLFVRSADHPDPMTLGGKPARELGVGWPALGRADRARREHNDGAAVGREAQPSPPAGAFGRRHLEFRQWPRGRCGFTLGEGQHGTAIGHAREPALAEA
jgi:hypothetical protein